MKRERPKGIKVQITLPEDVYKLVIKDIEDTFMTKSSWFLKAVHTQLEQGKIERPKKIIDLD
ncbi:MAG: hypothetical protein K2W92_03065 [Alphaproteobacteria bacterium]|jgi:uncharacterized protein YwbE|nr:hypothetical protein [Alphaproteobacteria bacterium]